MDITITNCNNIDFAKISIIHEKLNIKFAPNGTGKSTIAKVIVAISKGDQQLQKELMPFKLREENIQSKTPEVDCSERLNNVMCFNEEYINQFVYKQDELLSNSFEIFIRTEEYKKVEKEIDELVSDIKQLFTENAALESLISTLKEMGNAFKITKSGLSKASTGVKALSSGNIIKYVPSGLEMYAPFIQSSSSVSWIDWQTKGYEFAELSESCPFCTSIKSDKMDLIKKVGTEYDKNTIKNLVALICIIEKLGNFFSSDAKGKMEIITALKGGLAPEHEEFLATVKNQIDTFIGKLEKIKTLSAFQFEDGDLVSEKLPTFKLDLTFFSELNSVQMHEAIFPINSSIDKIVERAGHLQGKINIQRNTFKKNVSRYQDEINNFLAYAGYKYKVEIVGSGSESHLMLKHADYEKHLSGGGQHLSFGERNAFAIVLFMYECLSKKTDLIILDDPISSFDKNKKFAILEMLFLKDTGFCLKGKTVLMLTHDIEPIFDTVKSLASKFNNQTSASFLGLKKGIITEYSIAKNDIFNFFEACLRVTSSNKDDLIKLIYLRRYLEVSDGNGDAYQVISNIMHKRERAIDNREQRIANDCFPEMCSGKFLNGCNKIINFIETFSYTTILAKVMDNDYLKELYENTTNGYEKLQIFRILNCDCSNSVIKKFINETYHIENEFICQLDPIKFNIIPEYVVDECDKILQEQILRL